MHIRNRNIPHQKIEHFHSCQLSSVRQNIHTHPRPTRRIRHHHPHRCLDRGRCLLHVHRLQLTHHTPPPPRPHPHDLIDPHRPIPGPHHYQKHTAHPRPPTHHRHSNHQHPTPHHRRPPHPQHTHTHSHHKHHIIQYLPPPQHSQHPNRTTTHQSRIDLEQRIPLHASAPSMIAAGVSCSLAY